MIGIEVRPARPGEIDDILKFWAEAAEGTSVSDDPAGVAALLDRDPGALLVAGQDGRIVGTLIAGWDGWRASLYRLAVHPGLRRRGVAALLLRAAEERFAALGGRRVDAMVLDANTLAHHTWKAAGYVRQDQWARWVKPLGEA
jgi:ribosomal protein S18 acetylase RimI-like enzyme